METTEVSEEHFSPFAAPSPVLVGVANVSPHAWQCPPPPIPFSRTSVGAARRVCHTLVTSIHSPDKFHSF